MKKFKMPSAEYFISKAPKIDGFMDKAKGEINSVTGNLPKADKFKSDFEKKIAEKVGGIDIYNLPEPKSVGEIASDAGKKLGLNVDSEKIDSALNQIDEFKSSMTEKAIGGVKTAAEKVGLKLPSIPSEEEVAQMIVDSNPDSVEAIESKISSIESYIQSKLS